MGGNSKLVTKSSSVRRGSVNHHHAGIGKLGHRRSVENYGMDEFGTLVISQSDEFEDKVRNIPRARSGTALRLHARNLTSPES